MNRRGFFAGFAALLGIGALRAETNTEQQAVKPAVGCEHMWMDTPYVLVYGEREVRRGPGVRLCRRCGELRVNVREHRDAMLQAEYDRAWRVATGRADGCGFPKVVHDDGRV